MAVRVVTDSASDLPLDLATKHRIDIVGLTVRVGDEEFVDGVELTPAEFWTRSAAAPELPQTAAPPPSAFEGVFRRAAAEGAAGVVCVTLSAHLSGTFGAAQLAAQTVRGAIDVVVIDSRSVSMGEGLMAIACAEAAGAGEDLSEVAGVAADLVARTRVYAALDTLDNLVKGGRLGRAQGFVGTLLAFKPVIAVEQGEVVDIGRPRTRTRSLRQLVDAVRARMPVEHLAVMHAEAPDVEQFLDMLAAVYRRDDIIVSPVGAVIGTHGGPRLMGVTFHAAVS